MTGGKRSRQALLDDRVSGSSDMNTVLRWAELATCTRFECRVGGAHGTDHERDRDHADDRRRQSLVSMHVSALLLADPVRKS